MGMPCLKIDNVRIWWSNSSLAVPSCIFYIVFVYFFAQSIVTSLVYLDILEDGPNGMLFQRNSMFTFSHCISGHLELKVFTERNGHGRLLSPHNSFSSSGGT